MLFLAQSKPEISDRWGYHIRPIHYYEPIPDYRSITAEQIQRRRRLAMNEQYLLEAFLSFNEAFCPQLANYWIGLDYPDEAARLWPMSNNSAASFWMKRVK